MGFVPSKVIKLLENFLNENISENRIDFIIPLETKGALLVDFVYSSRRDQSKYPEILYLRGLEYLTPALKLNSKFALFDDFVFSGRTLFNAQEYMIKLGIPVENIYKLAFYKFNNLDRDKDVLHNIINETYVPNDTDNLQLSQTKILKSIQKLALDTKVPASYDNLHWDVEIDELTYNDFMKELSCSNWYLYYGKRGRFDASVLIIKSQMNTGFDSLSKIRFWYDSSSHKLIISPIVYPSGRKTKIKKDCSDLFKLIKSDKCSEDQKNLVSINLEQFVNKLIYSVIWYLFFKNITSH